MLYVSKKLKSRLVLNIAIFIAVFFCSLSYAAQNETVLLYGRNVSGNWYPYYIPENPQAPGIFAELIPLIMLRADIAVNPIEMPPRRNAQAIKEGLIDLDIVSPDWFENGQLADIYVASKPILTIIEYLVTLPENQTSFMFLDNIYGPYQHVGTVAGYYYFDDKKFTRADFPSESTLVLGLKKERFDVAILEEMTARYWAHQHKISITFGAIHSEGRIVIRLLKKHQYLIPHINNAINEMKQEGAIEKIINKYKENITYNN